MPERFDVPAKIRSGSGKFEHRLHHQLTNLAYVGPCNATQELVQHFRNLLLVKSVDNPRELLALSEEDIKALMEEAGKSTASDFLRYLVALQQGEPGLKFSSHPRIYLEAVLVKMCHFKKIVPLENIIKDIEALKKDFNREGTGEKSTEKPNPQKPEEREKDVVPKEEHEFTPTTHESPLEEREHQKTGTEQKDADLAIKDPTVKYFLDTFKAQVLTVEPLKKEKSKIK